MRRSASASSSTTTISVSRCREQHDPGEGTTSADASRAPELQAGCEGRQRVQVAVGLAGHALARRSRVPGLLPGVAAADGEAAVAVVLAVAAVPGVGLLEGGERSLVLGVEVPAELVRLAVGALAGVGVREPHDLRGEQLAVLSSRAHDRPGVDDVGETLPLR